MTGAGAPGAPGIIKCLNQDKNIELTVADASTQAVGYHLQTNHVQLPKGEDPDFIPALLAHCKERKVRFVLPLVTRELAPLAAAKKEFEAEGIFLLVSSTDSIRLANDKAVCYQFLQSKGIPVPRFFVVHTTEQFIHAAFELGHPSKPFCFKPTESNGSRGVRIVSDSLDESELLFFHKPYQLEMTYAHALQVLSSKPFPALLVSEYLPGMEYSVDCLARNGEARIILPRTRERMVNGISVKGAFEKNEEVIRYCRTIIDVLGLHGNIGIQVKLSDKNEPLLLEINPRVQGTIVAALGAGVNLPLLAIYQEAGIPIEEKDLRINWNTRFIRYWTEVFY